MHLAINLHAHLSHFLRTCTRESGPLQLIKVHEDTQIPSKMHFHSLVSRVFPSTHYGRLHSHSSYVWLLYMNCYLACDHSPSVSDQKPYIHDSPSVSDQKPNIHDIQAVSDQKPYIHDIKAVSDYKLYIHDIQAVLGPGPHQTNSRVSSRLRLSIMISGHLSKQATLHF